MKQARGSRRAERRAASGQRPLSFGRRETVLRAVSRPASVPSRPAVPLGDQPTYPSDEGLQ